MIVSYVSFLFYCETYVIFKKTPDTLLTHAVKTSKAWRFSFIAFLLSIIICNKSSIDDSVYAEDTVPQSRCDQADMSGWYVMYTVGLKNVALYFCQYLRRLLTDFPNFFTGALCRQFAIMWLLYIPAHGKCISTLLCKYKCKQKLTIIIKI